MSYKYYLSESWTKDPEMSALSEIEFGWESGLAEEFKLSVQLVLDGSVDICSAYAKTTYRSMDSSPMRNTPNWTPAKFEME